MELDRRNLLKALPALIAAPVVIGGKEVGKSFKVEDDGKYVVFVNAALVDVFEFASMEGIGLPVGTPIYAVNPGPQGMDEVIRIYKTE
jgi:hypothetical protein